MADTANEALKKAYSSLAAQGHLMKGSASDGDKYESIREMWQCQGVSLADDATNEAWYGQAAEYYEGNCDETVDGVLGGFASITDVDLAGSKRFLDEVQKLRSGLEWSNGAGCECGAGIGRVTKGLLLPLGVTRCDLVESSERLLFAAPGFIGDPNASKCRYYCEGLQTWQPPKDNYTIIWIQWVLIYLTDIDIIKFLKRCGDALKPNGVICLKENICDDELFVLDKDDASLTRALPLLLKLIEAAGFRVVHQVMQDDFPEEIFDVPMIAITRDGTNP